MAEADLFLSNPTAAQAVTTVIAAAKQLSCTLENPMKRVVDSSMMVRVLLYAISTCVALTILSYRAICQLHCELPRNFMS